MIRSYDQLQGGYIWDWVDQGLVETLVTTPDASPLRNHVSIMGRPGIVQTTDGTALSLSALDDWVEVYNDPAFDDLTELTLTVRVHPLVWYNPNPILTKGNYQFGLVQHTEDSLMFYLNTGRPTRIVCPVPQDWYAGWHDVVGIWNGENAELYIDGVKVGEANANGRIRRQMYPVNIGRNAETQTDSHPGWLAHIEVDCVQIFNQAIDPDQLQACEPSDPNCLLWLDFDRFDEGPTYYSYGISPFCVNGLVFPDREVQPELWQAKHTFVPVHIQMVDPRSMTIRITNEYSFTDLNELELQYRILRDGDEIETSVHPFQLEPGASRTISLPCNPPSPSEPGEWFLEVSFHLKDDTQWVDAGHEVAIEQFLLQSVRNELPVSSSESPEMHESGAVITVEGDEFEYQFSRETGTFVSMKVAGRELVNDGPSMSLWRAPYMNERMFWGEAEAEDWYNLGLDQMDEIVDSVVVEHPENTAAVLIAYTRTSSPNFMAGYYNQYMYTIDNAGTIRLDYEGEPFGSYLVRWLPRFGMDLHFRSGFEQVQWYGRGPYETVPDRQSGAPVGVYTSTVAELQVPYLHPQHSATRTDIRWLSLTDEDGIGLHITADEPFSAGFCLYDDIERAVYPFQLQPVDGVILQLDSELTGVGGTPVPVRPQYRVYPGRKSFSLTFIPLTGQEDLERIHRTQSR